MTLSKRDEKILKEFRIFVNNDCDLNLLTTGLHKHLVDQLKIKKGKSKLDFHSKHFKMPLARFCAFDHILDLPDKYFSPKAKFGSLNRLLKDVVRSKYQEACVDTLLEIKGMIDQKLEYYKTISTLLDMKIDEVMKGKI